MSEEERKPFRLLEVYKELTTIKDHLQSLLQPASTRKDSVPRAKKDMGQPLSSQVPYRPIFNFQQHTHLQTSQGGGRREADNLVRPGSLEAVHRRTMNSPGCQATISKQTQQQIQDRVLVVGGKEVAVDNSLKNVADGLKFEPKPRFQQKGRQIRREGKERQVQEDGWSSTQKRGGHARHVSQLTVPSSIQQYNEVPEKQEASQKEQIGSRFRGQKSNVLIANQKQIIKEEVKSFKRLARMRSDFSGLPSRNEECQPIRSGLSGKVKQLQESVLEKQQIIALLMQELQQIEGSFKELELHLWTVLKHFKPISRKETNCELSINEALNVLLRQFDQQKNQVKRLEGECEQWRRWDRQREQKIKSLEGRLFKVEKKDEVVSQMRDQNQFFKKQLQVLTAKLEVAVSENKVKDEFIVKFLATRNDLEKEAAPKLSEVLNDYLKKCDYPSNRLLQKLTSEEAQIRRLQGLLDRAKS